MNSVVITHQSVEEVGEGVSERLVLADVAEDGECERRHHRVAVRDGRGAGRGRAGKFPQTERSYRAPRHATEFRSGQNIHNSIKA